VPEQGIPEYKELERFSSDPKTLQTFKLSNPQTFQTLQTRNITACPSPSLGCPLDIP